MNDALKFLLAARRAEIHVLRQLAMTCELVDALAQLVHVLQRERGAANMYLASGGCRFVEQLAQYRADVDQVEARVRARFDRLDVDEARNAGSVRFFSRIAYVLHELDSLPLLRDRVRSFALSPDENAAAMSRLIAGVLAVVFEAADAAADPDVSRALVALFNFMQGKELAGQERAAGVAGFALGRFDLARQQRLVHLIDAQAGCFDVFAEFAEPELLLRWQNALPLSERAELEHFRRLAETAAQPAGFREDAGDRWFELTTERIDAMKQIEDALTARLSVLCAERIVATEAELTNHTTIMAALVGSDRASARAAGLPLDPAGTSTVVTSAGLIAGGTMTTQLGRSVLDLVQTQSQRIQRMADELNAARSALHERKVIERGKGLLMAHRGLSEDQAYRLLRQTAMDQGRRVVDVAESVLSLGSLLHADGRHPDRLRRDGRQS